MAAPGLSGPVLLSEARGPSRGAGFCWEWPPTSTNSTDAHGLVAGLDESTGKSEVGSSKPDLSVKYLMFAKTTSLITFQYSCRIQFLYLNAKVSGNIHTFTNWRPAGQNWSRKLRYNCPPGTRSRATGDVLPRAQRTKCSGFHISFDSHGNSPVFQRENFVATWKSHCFGQMEVLLSFK